MKKNEEVQAPVEVTPETTKKAFQLPYKVTCSVGGKEKAVRHEVLLKRMQGTKGNTLQEVFENHIKTYKCQECKREAKNAELEASFKKEEPAAE